MRTDFMLDIETTGLVPHKHAITSLALVEFDLLTGRLCNSMHYALQVPTSREYCEETMAWRKAHGVDEMEAGLYKEDCTSVLNMFSTMMEPRNIEDVYLWAKPTIFDIMFMQSYFAEFGYAIPWHYRYVRDLRSFIDGCNLDNKEVETIAKTTIDFEDEKAHDAFYDCLYQVECLRIAMNMRRS